MNETAASRNAAARPCVLIVSDDPEFARSVSARWQLERSAPAIAVSSSAQWRASAADRDLILAGPLSAETRSSTFSDLAALVNKPVICVGGAEAETSSLRSSHAHLLVIEQREGWLVTLILLANEILRRIEVLGRAHRAERLAGESQRYAILGRYMLDMRPNVNDALTSVLGNADLLLLEPGQAIEKSREQIKTIHRMSLRLNEIMQRFSSLASEMQAAEEEFPPEAARHIASLNSQPRS